MSSRGLFRSMLIIGGAQSVNVMLFILRLKLLAVWLGPAGVGLLGIYNNLQQLAGNTAGLGMQNSGVRQLASAREDERAVSRVKQVVLLAHVIQGSFAMAGVWLLREPIATWLTGDRTYATDVGLIGVAVLLMLLATAHTTLLQGLRHIGALGRITVLGAFGGTLVGLTAVWSQGMEGLLWFVLAQPLFTLLAALVFTRGLVPHDGEVSLTLKVIWSEWMPMAKLGSVFMLGGLATTGTLLVVRGWLTQDLGLEAAGHFAAAWSITMTYVGFLLGAMGADYFPRMSEVIHDRPRAHRLMNDQMQLGLALGGPVLILLLGLAPFAMWLLYSDEFSDAVTLLQWQSAGNLLKLACWPLGFAFVAAAQSRIFLFTQVNFNIAFMLIVWAGLPVLGLEIAGIAFLLGYAVHFVVLNFLVRRLHDFRWEPLSLKLLAVHTGVTLGLLPLVLMAPVLGGIVSVILALVTGFFGGHIVITKIGPHGRVEPLARIYATLGWPIRSSA